MSFFDEIDDFEELIETESETDFGNSLHSNVGDIVYYDPTSYQFMTASSFDSSKINVNCIDENWRTIMLGVVIRQYEDLSVDVLMSGFLMSEPLRLPIKYYYKDKRNYQLFHKFLINEGFIMLQESVYSKLALNLQQAEFNVNRIKKNAPSKGIIQVLNVTEKQYASIEYIIGKPNSKIIDNEDRLVVL